jgi:zinc/manganese transport system substrate-binding protein
MKPRLLSLLIGFLPLGLLATAPTERPLRIVTLHTVLTEVATVVGGDAVEVIGLVRPGIDPHVYDPTPADVRRMMDADLVLAAGLGMESYLEQLAASADLRGRLLVIGELLPPAGLVWSDHDHEHHHHVHDEHCDHGEIDPHWWHGIAQVQAAAEIVLGACADLRPAAAADFALRTSRYLAQLDDLQTWVRAAIATVPPDSRRLVTSHDAFGYLARDLGLTALPVSGLSTAHEPDARSLARLIRYLRTQRVAALFPDAGYNQSLIETVQRETGARLGKPLFSDGLGPADSPAATFAGMMRYNVTTIVRGLGGEVPDADGA